jgi:NAD(P)-dependent dehydrogenase (short-subunit alcohol dehydrogenase family)
MKINIASPWMIAGEAVKGFEELGHGMFVQVGNLFSHTVGTGFLSFGMQKAAAAHMVQYLALLLAKPYRWVQVQVSGVAPLNRMSGFTGSTSAIQTEIHCQLDLMSRHMQT